MVRSFVFSGQPSVANGHNADENHVSSTSVSPSSGILCPHQIWREMHQSLIFSNQSVYNFSHRGGWNRTRLSLTAASANFASSSIFMNHCSDGMGSMTVLHR